MDPHHTLPPYHEAAHTAHTAHTPILPGGAPSHISLVGIEPEAGMQVIQDIMLLRQKAEYPHLDLRLLYHRPELPASLDPTQTQRFPRWVQPNRGIRVDGEPVSVHHAKFMLVDADIAGQGRAYIMTANFTAQALGGNHAGYANREYILCDTDPNDLVLLQAIFLADQAGKPLPPVPSSSHLVISDVNAITVLPALLSSARHSINIQVEYLNDPPGPGTLNLKQLLLQAAQQGVKVQVMLPPLVPDHAGAPSADNYETYHALVPKVAVNVTPQYFMHAKLIIIDQTLAFVGSQNLSHQSLRYSREVGILIANKPVVSHLSKIFDADWAYAQQTRHAR
jgi:phosphatidylserine/phosphatidylglycerophosphate/cardiolipin synthase-like enzyme